MIWCMKHCHANLKSGKKRDEQFGREKNSKWKEKKLAQDKGPTLDREETDKAHRKRAI